MPNNKISLFEERKDLETADKLILDSTVFFLNEICRIDNEIIKYDPETLDEDDQIIYNNLCNQLRLLYNRIKLEALEHDKLSRKLKQIQIKYNGKIKI